MQRVTQASEQHRSESEFGPATMACCAGAAMVAPGALGASTLPLRRRGLELDHITPFRTLIGLISDFSKRIRDVPFTY